MKIRELIKRDAGFQYVADNLECMSAAGRRKLLDTGFTTKAQELEAEWERLQITLAATSPQPQPRAYIDLRHCFMQLHDLQGTLASLSCHTPLNEVELFEIKNLSYLTGKARQAVAELGMDKVLPLPDLGEVFSILDPDGTGVVNFYIYDTYDARLAPLRAELRTLQEHGGDPQRIADLLAEQNEVQQKVCIRLCDSLYNHSLLLATALEQMAYGDFLCAKAELCRRWHLSRPSIGARLQHQQLINPRLKEHNETLGLRYQPVDIVAYNGVTLVTGANMAGKTVLLKSLGTAQLMAQTGMFVPSDAAVIALVDDVVYSIGDEQNEMNGLSSYASEIIKISDIVSRCRKEKLLVLIDEPARTTNPVEGKALVQSLISILEQSTSISLVTTHYGQLGSNCRRLRVRGFVEDMADVPLTPQNINRFIDYSLEEDTSDEVPHEALRIAEILGCDHELIDSAQKYLALER